MTNTRSIIADAFARPLPTRRPNISVSGGIHARLVDCEIVRKRKAEVQLWSPADIVKFLGPSAIDESYGSVPLKELLISHSNFAPGTEEQYPNVATKTLSLEKPSKKLGGRPRKRTEEKQDFLIGRLVDQRLPQFESGLRLLKKMRLNGDCELKALRNELAKHHFSAIEADALLDARTPMGAAKRFVAQSLSSQKRRLSLKTIHSAYSRYLRKLKSKDRS